MQSVNVDMEVHYHDAILAKCDGLTKVLETASPLIYYISFDQVDLSFFSIGDGRSYCEWKGLATYWGLNNSFNLQVIAWSYERPSVSYHGFKDHIVFYPGRVSCFLQGQRVRLQPGKFYGGWLTDNICGPAKGGPSTEGW